MRKRIHQVLSRRAPALLWTLLIFALMVIPGKMLPSEEQTYVPNLDKVVHVILFGGFVFLWSFYFAVKQEKYVSSNKIFFHLLIIACLYGIGMEYVQKYLIPNRDFDLLDITADIAGAIIGFIIVRMTIAGFKKTDY